LSYPYFYELYMVKANVILNAVENHELF
jgi:hypothetical protein